VLRNLVAGILASKGEDLLAAGKARWARPLFAIGARLQPANARLLYHAARAAAAVGNRDAVAFYCDRALERDSSLWAVRELIASTFLHGEHYLSLLKRIHEWLKPRTYLEIGVDSGASLRLAGKETRALGVDPAAKIAFSLGDNVRLFQETSDSFFSRDVQAELAGLPVDVAFIDGMHHFDQALRDFINVERLCHPGATILIHDCFPHDRMTSQRERHLHFWSGDVWRLVVLLKKYRPDLSVHTIGAVPTGLALIRRLDPASRTLADQQVRLTDEFLALDYGYLHPRKAEKLGLVPSDWPTVQALLTDS